MDNTHEFPGAAESPESYSAILTKTVAAPIQILTVQLQVQHKAIQSLTKSLDMAKSSHTESYAAAATSTASTAPHPPQPHPTKPIPITDTPDKRILLRCGGESPPSFNLPYHELVAHINSVLTPLDPPRIVCASRTKDGGIFLVPESKETTKLLVESWSRWGPVRFPGDRIIPPAVYSHIQLDGIPHAAAPALDALTAELMERYP
ncbi:hypothetical protein B0H16DRAFT_1751593 [Mycena metata]|uniref:Uncharacterized protein n=1 Tax=Mycena metata TaxID=1033252 RepID=A0AAD7DLW5_9AGAR|nr:hypothetical protein B0H16DRAFT_1751593 [Mycena metata]